MAKKTVSPVNTAENTSSKIEQLTQNISDGFGQDMTTNQGLKINDDQNSLKAGDRGATLLEDFILREKITHFDHERIPERVVHARGSGAHGVFKLYKAIPELTKALFLNDTEIETPVFVRFSTVAGSRGSTDLARDVRGFAVKFYTQEGNFDLVGNNMPVFFIQDALKFPDLVHAVKPEQDNEMPQAASAHDTFWDFISLMPESTHMIMWAMSDRAIPRSLRMMEGFGVHSFRFVNAQGESCFVKFHWKPLLGVHSVTWDEAQTLSGKDPDFHRRDLWEAIQSGSFPEWEFGVQIIPESDEHKYDFDILDPTKLIPEELVPVQIIGKMTLNRNPDNFFAETEQVAFHVGHLVPGIDFTNDPLLQGRLFSYTDTQLLRLGGPNFHEIPINRSVVPIYNNQRDGLMRQTIAKGKVAYNPNAINQNFPAQVKEADGGFTSYNERIDAQKIRARSRSFFDHFSQAKLFYDSQSEPEKNHIIDALSFELGKVKAVTIRLAMIGRLNQINEDLAHKVAKALGLKVDKNAKDPGNGSIPANGNPEEYKSISVKPTLKKSEALSMANTIKDNIKTRKIAMLVANGVNGKSVEAMKKKLLAVGAVVELIGTQNGQVLQSDGKELPVDESLLTTSSVCYDAVFIPDGEGSIISLSNSPDAIHFLNQSFKHCKAIAFDGEAKELINSTYFAKASKKDSGVLTSTAKGNLAKDFIAVIAKHRVWEREKTRKVPA